MERKAVSGTMLTLLLISMFTLAFKVRLVIASGTIYIKPDGSIDPPTAPIQRAGNVYTFIDNITDSIVVQRDNIIIDGNSYTLLGAETGYGFELLGRSNVTIKKTYIRGFQRGIFLNSSARNTIINNTLNNNVREGIQLYNSSHTTVTDNTLTNNSIGLTTLFSSFTLIAKNNITHNIDRGVLLSYSTSNLISNNNVSYNSPGPGAFSIVVWRSHYNEINNNDVKNNYYSVYLFESFNNTFTGNNITNSLYGIALAGSNNNRIYHNNFISNTFQLYNAASINIWEYGYPSGGNYWSNYGGIDNLSGPNQDQPGSDGLGDTPYVIDANNRDRYPLMVPWVPPPPSIQLGLTLDGSGSILPSDFTIIKQGVAKAIRNNMPHDGTMELTVVQFGTWDPTGARVEIPPTVICVQNYESIATAIEAMTQGGDNTPMADGLFLTWDTMKDSTNFATAMTQLINVATDGYPNVKLQATPPAEWGTPPGTADSDVTWVRDKAATEGLDEVDAEGIGVTYTSLIWIRDYLVYPQPGSIAPPYTPGWVEWVPDATEFATAIGQKIKRIAPPTYNLTITTTTKGTTNPMSGIYTYTNGTVVWVSAIPDVDSVLYYWELDGANVGAANPISVTMDSNHALLAVFDKVTIQAYCYIEATYVSVSITKDGTPTGYNTPHTFTFPTGSHTFTVPDTDLNGHPFYQWSTGEASTTITVTTGGTYTAYYVTPYNLTIITTQGGTTNPSPGTYTYGNGSMVSITAIPDTNYYLDHWELDGFNFGSDIQITVTMDSDHTLHAIFRYPITPGGRKGPPLLT